MQTGQIPSRISSDEEGRVQANLERETRQPLASAFARRPHQTVVSRYLLSPLFTQHIYIVIGFIIVGNCV